MKAYNVTTPDGIDAIELIEKPVPEVGPYDVLVQIQASCLNYRDLLITLGGYQYSDVRPIVPLSDGAGVVRNVGAAVTDFKVGDRVMGCFFQDWADGQMTDKTPRSALGGAIDGVLAEYAVFKQWGTVKIPQHLSFAEASTLPCAALTAWHALQAGNIKAGDRVLLLGTGGVSSFGLQFAKACGAEVIITSSSDEKLEKARALGADFTINYRSYPDWHKEVLEITNGEGVNNVLEIGGAETLAQSISAAGLHGTISMIGLVTGNDMTISLAPALKMQSIKGIYVGSTAMFRQMNAALSYHQIKPVIDKVYGFNEAQDAYRYLQSAAHVGKVVIEH